MSTNVTFSGGNSTPEGEPSPGHNERMIALAEGKAAPEQTQQTTADSGTPERPAWLPEKFASAEAMAAAYAELERKLSSGQQQQQQQPATTDGVTTEEAAASQAAAAGVDYAAVSAEFAEKGQLSSETYADLAAKGFPKDVVDSYIAGQQALADRARVELEASIGGKESLEQVLSWAKTGLTADQKAAWNSAIDRNNPAELSMMLAGFKAAMTAASGRDPAVRVGAQPGNASVAGFQSEAEMTAAMRDPRYKSDPAYRKMVSDRISAAAW